MYTLLVPKETINEPKNSQNFEISNYTFLKQSSIHDFNPNINTNCISVELPLYEIVPHKFVIDNMLSMKTL